MEDTTKAKIFAGLKVGWGAIQIGSAFATAAGTGLVGTLLKNHHMMRQAGRIAYAGLESGTKAFDEGVEEWKRAR